MKMLHSGRHELDLGGSIDFDPHWIDGPDADALFRELRSSVPWAQGAIVLFGREVLEPRLTAWIGDADYTYSGRTMRAMAWPASLAALRDRVAGVSAGPLNSVLLNLYRDGRDSMGMHSDDEPELGDNPTIASVSLGATRTFILSPKRKSARRDGSLQVALGSGSLLVMSGVCQHRYRHGVPKEPGCTGERINLTFRRILDLDLPRHPPVADRS